MRAMAYQSNHPSYGPRPIFNPGSGPPQFHPSHSPQQQQQQSYPNAYPSHVQLAQGPEGQMNNGPRQHNLPNRNSGIAGGTTNVPDDPFKKPYLPPKHAQPLPNNLPCPPSSAASSAPTPALFPPQGQSKQIPNSSTSYPAPSSMTVSALPATSSAQSTPTSEAPSQATDTASQISRLSPIDQERVDALLNVNNLLLQEVQVLQKIGLKTSQSGNPQSPQQANPANASSPQTKPEGSDITPTSTGSPAAAGANPPTNSTSSTPTTTTPTTGVPQQTYNQKKFVEYMKRLQSNIMFLVSMSDTTKQRQKAPYPSHLELLPNWLAEGMKEEEKPQFEALKEGYNKLRQLWPDWKSGPPGLNAQQPQPQAQAQNRQQQASVPQIQQPQAQSNVPGKI